MYRIMSELNILPQSLKRGRRPTMNIKDNLNAYHNRYYHEHRTTVKCECGALIVKTGMVAHIRTKKHFFMLEYLRGLRPPYAPSYEGPN